MVASVYLFIAGGIHYRMSQFLGIDQIKTGSANRALSEHDTFETSGILSVIRHPWYSAGIMIIWAGDISLLSLLINIVITAYFLLGHSSRSASSFVRSGTNIENTRRMFQCYSRING